MQNKTDINENQLDKPLDMLPLPDHLPFSTAELEIQQEPQDINIQNCSQYICRAIKVKTACEPSNYELKEGRPKGTHRHPTYNLSVSYPQFFWAYWYIYLLYI